MTYIEELNEKLDNAVKYNGENAINEFLNHKKYKYNFRIMAEAASSIHYSKASYDNIRAKVILQKNIDYVTAGEGKRMDIRTDLTGYVASWISNAINFIIKLFKLIKEHVSQWIASFFRVDKQIVRLYNAITKFLNKNRTTIEYQLFLKANVGDDIKNINIIDPNIYSEITRTLLDGGENVIHNFDNIYGKMGLSINLKKFKITRGKMNYEKVRESNNKIAAKLDKLIDKARILIDGYIDSSNRIYTGEQLIISLENIALALRDMVSANNKIDEGKKPGVGYASSNFQSKLKKERQHSLLQMMQQIDDILVLNRTEELISKFKDNAGEGNWEESQINELREILTSANALLTKINGVSNVYIGLLLKAGNIMLKCAIKHAPIHSDVKDTPPLNVEINGFSFKKRK